ncbi:imelysin family protein [Crenobacter cavernae]|uniref:Imelysin-like domain-containing protein n=1 Tax=Crenobacter cavernae TaxID=2290923 RepID=A0A345Y8V2_9NEIS|nr:imelysin family protein [Crenobacter cavernae]AXK40354.1 hypothetical protein DWG20_13470 [Crenobacter cavernae]
MKRLLLIAALLAAPPAMAAATAEQEAAAERLLSGWATSPLLASIERFASRSAALEPAFESLCAKPADAKRLAGARAAWQSAYLAWMPVSSFNWGPTALRRTGRQLAFRPARAELITAAITADAGRKADEWDKVGVPAKGFAAIEALLYKQPKSLAEPAACAYLVRLGKEAGDEAKGLAADWRTFADELKHAGEPRAKAYPKASAAVGDVVNLLIAATTELGEKTFGKIAKQKTDSVLGAASGNGRALVAAQWQGLAEVVIGKDGGLAAYLDTQYEKPVLARQLRDAIAGGKGAIAALPANLAAARPAQLDKARAAVARLQDLLENPAAQALDLTVSFNEADGD